MKLTQKRLKELLHYNKRTGIFTRLEALSCVHVGDIAGSLQLRGYIKIYINGQGYYGHRLAWFYVTGEWPPDQIDVDHKNLNKSDNRFSNLRLATRQQGSGNISVHRDNLSGLKGVSFIRGKNRVYWQARIRGEYLGLFPTPEEAHAAYVAAAKKHFGDFARAK